MGEVVPSLAFPTISLRPRVDTEAMELAVLPKAVALAPVRVDDLALAMLNAFLVEVSIVVVSWAYLLARWKCETIRFEVKLPYPTRQFLFREPL